MKRTLAWMVIFALLLTGCGAKQEAAWQEQYDLGVRYMEDGDYEEAILAFSAAIEIDPKRADAYTSLAEIYMELGEYDKAVDILEQGLSNLEGDAAEELEELLAQAERMASIDFDHLVQDAYRETIQDGYDTYMEPSEWAVPKIMLDGPEIDELNDEIWDTLFQNGIQDALDAAAEGYSTGYGCSYQWAVNGDILSIWIECHPFPWGWVDFYVYNISIRSGEQLRDRDVYSAAGLSSSKYRQLVRDAAGSQFWEPFVGQDMDYFIHQESEMFNIQLQNTISEENVQLAKPFLNGEGHLCAVVPVYSMAGADYYWAELDLEDFTLVPDYEKEVESQTSQVNLTEEQAREIACNYWHFTPGDRAPETGFKLYVTTDGAGTVQAPSGKTYYAFLLRWLVDEGTDMEHLSTCDWVYVDAETGELVQDYPG